MDNLKDLSNDPNIIWEKRITKNGKEFHIGYHKDAELLDTSSEKTPFHIYVNWHALPSVDSWISLDEDFTKTTGISRYALGGSFLLYSYILHFTNEKHYDYQFVDKTEDVYECNTYRNGDHYIRYDSDNPDIIHITGY